MSASGTSEVGLQVLDEGQDGGSATFKIIINASPLLPFRRVGYFYLVEYDEFDPLFLVILSRGAVYIPGIKFTVDTRLVNSGTYRLYVNWNESGLEWLANFE